MNKIERKNKEKKIKMISFFSFSSSLLLIKKLIAKPANTQ
jgi:hypothetical protein